MSQGNYYINIKAFYYVYVAVALYWENGNLGEWLNTNKLYDFIWGKQEKMQLISSKNWALTSQHLLLIQITVSEYLRHTVSFV